MNHTITITKTAATNILRMKGKIGMDEITLEQKGKHVYFTAMVDGTGTETRILKQDLIDWLWVHK